MFRGADRADCCLAQPAVAVILPPTAARSHTAELLMCHHHYRVNQAALDAIGAMAYDRDGQLLVSGTDLRAWDLERSAART